MTDKYIYAVTSIRGKELKLLSRTFMEQLLASPDEASALSLLRDKGWGEDGQSAEEILAGEEEKTWKVIRELVPDMSVFDVFLYENDFHNLKAAIKETLTQGTHPGIYIGQGTVPWETMQKALTERDFSKFPERMKHAAKEALDVLLTTRDGQLCDCIIDSAALDAIRQAGKASGSELLAIYGELRCVTGDINIAYRAGKNGKDKAFLLRSLAPCETLNKDSLAEAAVHGEDALFAYLERTPYKAAVAELSDSVAAFERWCDDLLIEKIRPQRTNPFGLDPLAAYILARRNEIKTARIILTGKRNDLPDDMIRGRIRKTYV